MKYIGRHPFTFRSVTEFASDADYQRYYARALEGMPRLPKHNHLVLPNGAVYAVKRKPREGE